MIDVSAPRLEGVVTLDDGRRLGFAEFGHPAGRPIIWMHGTPGARRQVPHDARRVALELGLRIVGIDRPGVGDSTGHLYGQVRDFVPDLEVVADRLGFERFAMIGLSGGGPYVLAAAHDLPDRVPVVAVMGGVAPTRGPEAIGGGLVSLATRTAPWLNATRVPLAMALEGIVRLARPIANPAIDMYARLSPPGDRRLLNRPEFKAMFIDDLTNGSRGGLKAPIFDAILFTRPWGFRVADVSVPVHWWHGDDDRIVPVEHGRHMVALLPDAELTVMPGESHLGGLGVTEDVLTTIDAQL